MQEPFQLAPEQLEVVEAAPSARLRVDAGPGTGKTAVAIARVAWLLEKGELEPDEIWLVSFTRTAVQELRNRIAERVHDEDLASGLRISTLDSMAWQIRSRFDAEKERPTSYEQGIVRLIDLLATNQDAKEFLAGIRHFVVDEAQDIVGNRAELVLEVIHALPPDAGVTIMSDEAQAIYGFAEEGATDSFTGTNLPSALREYMAGAFTERELTQIHRTDDPSLVELLLKGRAAVRAVSGPAEKRYDIVRELILSRRHYSAEASIKELAEDDPALEGAFLLFRRRGDALQAANYLNGRPRRLRLSGLPPAVPWWLGAILWDWTEPELRESEFLSRWQERVRTGEMPGRNAWGVLLRLAGVTKASISTHRLARLVARPLPPIELAAPDFGESGPVFGTIHAAKGREADIVWVYLPESHGVQDGDVSAIEEEARILFVGASRARHELHVGEQSSRTFARTLDDSGRAYTTKWSRSSPAASVEVGKDGDIRMNGLVGRDHFADPDEVRLAQQFVRDLAGEVTTCSLIRGPAPDFTFAIHIGDDEGPVAGYLDQQLNSDLFKVGNKVARMREGMRGHPNGKIRYVSCLGARTVAMDPEDSLRDTLLSPWRESGFALAPMLGGYPVVYFK